MLYEISEVPRKVWWNWMKASNKMSEGEQKSLVYFSGIPSHPCDLKKQTRQYRLLLKTFFSPFTVPPGVPKNVSASDKPFRPSNFVWVNKFFFLILKHVASCNPNQAKLASSETTLRNKPKKKNFRKTFLFNYFVWIERTYAQRCRRWLFLFNSITRIWRDERRDRVRKRSDCAIPGVRGVGQMVPVTS